MRISHGRAVTRPLQGCAGISWFCQIARADAATVLAVLALEALYAGRAFFGHGACIKGCALHKSLRFALSHLKGGIHQNLMCCC